VVLITFHKYKKIYQIGHAENEDIFANPKDEIVIEEKIDGANFRFMRNGDRIIYGSRTQSIGDSTVDLIGGNWQRCVHLINELFQKNPDAFHEGYIYYGECCVKHTMNYDWENIPSYLGFDEYSLHTEMFIHYREAKKAFERMGLVFVPIIKECLVEDLTEINDDMVPVSAYVCPSSQDRQAEGIVFKNYTAQIMGKYVRDKFKEANAEAFGGSPKYNKVDETHNADFVFKYCTNPRIDKIIFKLIDEGISLDLKMMAHLPKLIYIDIWDEHWQEIRDSNWMLDFRKLRKLVPKRCLAVLKQVMVNNALNEKGGENGR